MKNIASGLSVVRFVIIAITCALLFFSNAVPATAVSSPKSDTKEATTQLLETQKKTDEITKQAPPTLEKVQEQSNEGLNEVQGAADKEKMKRPENSQGAESVEDEIKGLLDKVTGKN